MSGFARHCKTPEHVMQLQPCGIVGTEGVLRSRSQLSLSTSAESESLKATLPTRHSGEYQKFNSNTAKIQQSEPRSQAEARGAAT